MKSILVCVVFFTSISFAQQDSASSIPFQQKYDELLEFQTDDNGDGQIMVDEMEYRFEHPAPIDRLTYDDAFQFGGISEEKIKYFIALCDSHKVKSAADLTLIPGINAEETETLSSLCAFSDGEKVKSSTAYFIPDKFIYRSRLDYNFQTVKGLKSGKFNGPPYSIYQRIRVQGAQSELDMLFTSDVGENMTDGFLSGALVLKDLAAVDELVIGNYTISSGEGLVLARSGSALKGSDPIQQIKKRGLFLIPHNGTDESSYFSGCAAVSRFDRFIMAEFYSLRNRSATLDPETKLLSLYTSGLYRTGSELKKKNMAEEEVFGFLFSYTPRSTMKAGCQYIHINYDRGILHKGKILSQLSVIGLSAAGTIGVIHFFAEAASDDGKSSNKLLGVACQISKQVDIATHLRSYAGTYRNPFAKSFGEGISSGDENGIYAGVEYRPWRGLTLSSYYDEYTNIHNGEFIRKGNEYCYRGTFHVRGNMKISAQYKRKYTGERFQENIRCTIDIDVIRDAIISQQYEACRVWYEKNARNEKGILWANDLRYFFRTYDLQVTARMEFFDTDSYDSRLYHYESNVAGKFGNPPLYGQGVRWYAIADWQLWKSTRIAVKYSETKKLHVIALGSGDDEIDGNLDNHITFQIDIQL